MKSVHQHFRLHRAHLAGLDDNSASGSDCRSHLDRDRTGARINMPTTPAGSMTTLEVPTVLARSKSLRTSLKCRKMLAARLFEPFARSCGAPYSRTVASTS